MPGIDEIDRRLSSATNNDVARAKEDMCVNSSGLYVRRMADYTARRSAVRFLSCKLLMPVCLLIFAVYASRASAQERHAVAVTAGGWVILRDDGKVVTFRDPSNWHDPVIVKGLNDVIAIAGANPGWALRRDGVVLKWDYHCDDKEQPICDVDPARPIPEINNVTAISRYAEYGLLLKRDGSVWGVGEDSDGQITGISADQSAKRSRAQNPIMKVLSRPIIQIAAGWKHAVAVDDEGQVWTWGGATHPAVIGQGETVREADGSQSVRIAAIPPASKVSAGVQSYSIDRDGRAWRWGTSTIVAINGKITTGGPIPTSIAGLQGIIKVNISSLFTALLDSQGRVAIIGIGPGTTLHPRGDPLQGSYELVPAFVQNLSGVKDISGGADGLAVIDEKNQVFILGAPVNHGSRLGPLDIGK